MDFRQLNYFIAVAQEGHLGRAADKLCLSQPPLSRQIQALEDELGTALFIRTARGMLLTPAGEALLKDALNLRRMADDAADRARRAGQGQLGRIDIGVYGSAVFGVVPRLLTAFSAAHPEVQIALSHAPAREQADALRQGRVLAVFERWMPDDPALRAERVAREPLLVALQAGHRLAAREVVPVAELREETLVLGIAPTMSALAMRLCGRHGFTPRLAPPVSDITLTGVIAATGAAVAIVPASMGHVGFPGVVYRALDTQERLDVYCYSLREEPSPLLAALRASLHRQAVPDDLTAEIPPDT
ncbi:LysR substrate-binding domain-containing protein [Pseudaquabacterium rugosum]|uniref:LysR substrate-binding domain-containing protein n=1 Tax=Pseudaquabacterium rugosum TaxID=2984194 RepID=A0ABU9BES9_9BURK